MMNILISISHLVFGGAQTFVTELSNELIRRGHQVYVYDYQYFGNVRENSVINKFAPAINILALPPFILKIKRTIADRRTGYRYDNRFLDALTELHIRWCVRTHRINLVNTHLYHSDNIVTRALSDYHIPIVLTDHGDYRYVESQGITVSANLNRIMKRVDGIIYNTDSNIERLSSYCNASKTELKKIYTGISKTAGVSSGNDGRKGLGIASDALVFGMVARGIPEKGWTEAIEAFKIVLANVKKEVHIILVGSGPCLSELEASLPLHLRPRVHLTGFSSQPGSWISSFDVGLLPSYFPGESLPSSVMEYLSCGKPVIATDIGEIKKMVTTDNGLIAGHIIASGENGKPKVDELADAMLAYVNSPDQIHEKSKLAAKAFHKFDIVQCVNAYETFFNQVWDKSYR